MLLVNKSTLTHTLSPPHCSPNKRANIPRTKGELLYVECSVLWQDQGEVLQYIQLHLHKHPKG